MDIVLILVFAIVFLCSFLFLFKPRGLPPGPITLPVIGSWFFLRQIRGKRPHLAFFEASKKYGKIFSYRIGSQLLVVLHGSDAIHEALVKQSDVFSDRPNFLPGFKKFQSNPLTRGIIFEGYNHQWRTLRRFTLKTMRDFGVGKSTLEEKIMMEIDAGSAVLEAATGNAVEISPVLQKMIGNVIYWIIFGKRFDFDDPDSDIIRRLSTMVVTGEGGGTNIALFFPAWISRLFVRESNKIVSVRDENLEKIKEFVFEQIKQHEESYDENNIRDFLDLYIQDSRDPKEELGTVFTKSAIPSVVQELFIAGKITVYCTLDWAFLFMSENPEMQEKCQKEIDNVIGNKVIKYSDREILKYVHATIMEVQRCANVAPLAVQHCASQDTTLMDYHIPRGTIIVPNIYSSSMDSIYWEEPHKFNPDRFIDGTGDIIKFDAFMPFSVGPRTCLGEPLATRALFLVFANLLQRFKFERENVTVKHSMELKPNQAISAPYPYKMRITKR